MLESTKVWNTLFRPQCFGTLSVLQCIDKYFKHSTVTTKVLPCKHYWKCFDKANKRKKELGIDEMRRIDL